MKRWSSLRLTEAPMPVDVMSLSPERLSQGPRRFSMSPSACCRGRSRQRFSCCCEPALPPVRYSVIAMCRASLGSLLMSRMPAHRLGAGRDRLDDIVVARAAADIALELLADRMFLEIVALAAHHVDGGHDHARRAISA